MDSDSFDELINLVVVDLFKGAKPPFFHFLSEVVQQLLVFDLAVEYDFFLNGTMLIEYNLGV